MIVQPVVVPATAKADCPAAFLRRAREKELSPGCCCWFLLRFVFRLGLVFLLLFFLVFVAPDSLATAGFVPAADPFDPADSGFAAVAVVVVVVLLCCCCC